MIAIKINSKTSPQDIFKMQADAEALEEWAKRRENPPMQTMERASYLSKLGKEYLSSNKN